MMLIDGHRFGPRIISCIEYRRYSRIKTVESYCHYSRSIFKTRSLIESYLHLAGIAFSITIIC
jgi:hypothetical protein